MFYLPKNSGEERILPKQVPIARIYVKLYVYYHGFLLKNTKISMRWRQQFSMLKNVQFSM